MQRIVSLTPLYAVVLANKLTNPSPSPHAILSTTMFFFLSKTRFLRKHPSSLLYMSNFMHFDINKTFDIYFKYDISKFVVET